MDHDTTNTSSTRLALRDRRDRCRNGILGGGRLGSNDGRSKGLRDVFLDGRVAVVT